MINNELLTHLDATDKKLFKKKIKKYRSSKFSGLTREQLSNRIMDVLCTEYSNGYQSFAMQANILNIPTETAFYRVRWIDPTENPLNPKSMLELGSAWMPPSERVQSGRVNRKGEALLYTATAPATALAEARIKDGDLFALIIYQSKSSCRLNSIGLSQDNKNELNISRRAKIEALEDFLVSEFSRDSGSEREHIYLASDIITKDYYDYPETIGWSYKSVADPTGVNICFKGEFAKEYLDAKIIVIGKLQKTKSEQYINIMCSCILDKNNTEHVFSTKHKGGPLPGLQKLHSNQLT
jgi:hypothetical protein